MPLPTSRDVHVDQLLTNISISYTNQTYIADSIFPLVPVRKQSDIVPKYDQSYWFRDEAKLRAPGTYADEGGYAVDTSDTYFCPRYSFAKGIPDETRDNADAPFELDREATEYVTDKLQMRRERAFATDFFTTSTWTTDKTGGTDFTVWSNYAGSSPLVDVTAYKDTVEALIGREPNKFVIGKEVLVQLQWHPDLVDSIKYTQKGILTQDMIASLLGFESLLVGRTIFTSTKEGTAEASVTYSRIWGKHGLMVYVPSSPSLRTPAAGYTFVWQRVPAAIQYIVRHRDDRAEKDIVEANSYFDQKATAARAGLFLSGAVA
jgi:hypothetical protein